ncbi:hypothetical protein ACOSQ4_008720 [Xanthoceras sorbifolium]
MNKTKRYPSERIINQSKLQECLTTPMDCYQCLAPTLLVFSCAAMATRFVFMIFVLKNSFPFCDPESFLCICFMVLKVTCNELEEKIIALYFAGSSCVQSNHFTPILIEAYNDLIISMKKSFEVILVSSDNDEESFQKHFSTMPWLALPQSNQTARDSFKSLYAIGETPQLIILNQKGHLLSSNGLSLVYEFGSKGYPFTPERIKQLRDEEEMKKKKNQSLRSVLATPTRDFVISNDGKLVPIKN